MGNSPFYARLLRLELDPAQTQNPRSGAPPGHFRHKTAPVLVFHFSLICFIASACRIFPCTPPNPPLLITGFDRPVWP